MRNDCILHTLKCLCGFVMMVLATAAWADNPVKFQRIGVRDGLSSSQVNCVIRDARGFIWMGTISGLDRFDGFRFRHFYHEAAEGTLPDNTIDDIYEDAEGNLWVHTLQGWCRFDPLTEQFDTHPGDWLRQRGIEGTVECLCTDSRKNLWLTTYDHGCYYRSADGGTTVFFQKGGSGERTIPEGAVTDIAFDGSRAVLMYNDGTMVELDPQTKQVLRTDRSMADRLTGHTEGYSLFIDAAHNRWVATNGATWVCEAATGLCHPSVADFLRSKGIDAPQRQILLKDLITAPSGEVWVATDHDGLLRLNLPRRMLTQYQYDKNDDSSLPDNTVQSLFADATGALWIGTYKNGVAYCSDRQTRFETLPLGDVCTMTEDADGRLWCGTNDKGILCYDRLTNTVRNMDMAQTGLGSQVVVCSLTARDGSLWFGAYNGGLTHYRNGSFHAYRAQDSALASDNVWALAELPDGRLMIATLGKGLQLLNPETGVFVTYDSSNSQLASDYLFSLFVSRQGMAYIGHSAFYSVFDPQLNTFVNDDGKREGKMAYGPTVNQLMVDSRGLLWLATASGAVMYDHATGQTLTVEQMSSNSGRVACSVAEGIDGDVWIVWGHAVARVRVSKDGKGQWQLFTNYYDEVDGLQSRQFNFRSIFVNAKGDVMMGGQDGVSVLSATAAPAVEHRSKPLFSGMMLFDHPIAVGEEYNGRVVLDHAINEERTLHLRHSENAFTILFAPNQVEVPEKSRFQYRLKGFNDRWLMTPEGQPQATYTNLSSGTYDLEVRMVYRDGTVGSDIEVLRIVIHPPFYLTTWAFLLYALLAAAALWLAWRTAMRRQQAKFRMEQIEAEAKRAKKTEEEKMEFFTNVSHELRTPLTLIISPLSTMMRNEGDEAKRSKLSLMHRNAVRLLNMVNQILDFNKLGRHKPQLNLSNGDIVAFIGSVCQSFQGLAEKKVDCSFVSDVPSLVMAFDEDKIRKVMYNLLSNALKFTPEGGQVTVTIAPHDDHTVSIAVADTGCGIADEEKQRIFERFYQVHNGAQTGGSGVGLHLVKAFVNLHGGDVTVADREGGGAVFTVVLPVRRDDNLPAITAQTEMPVAAARQQRRGERQKAEVLLVDDSDDFLQFMNEVLSERYHVSLARDGAEALRRVAQQQPDVILSDVMMPVMDGVELCRRIKGDERTAKIPFIMLTARMTDEQKIEGMEQGADDYITKPFNIDLLYLRIDNLLKWKADTLPSQTETDETTKPVVKYVPVITEEKITSVDEQFVQKATAYVEEHLADTELTVERMSEAMHTSRVNFYKRLLSLTGSTPSEFIRQIRIRHAERLLREGQYGVSEVAYKVGFNNPRSFTKYFREMYGVIPSQYKSRPT